MNKAVKNQVYPKKSQYISLDSFFDMMYEMIVSLSPRLVYPLLYNMRSEQICKTIIISKGLISLYIIED